MDETGHKEKGLRLWTWCFRATGFTCFKIESSRGSKVLVAILGEAFEGILGCDYFSAYRKYRGDFNTSLQFCLAHLIRDVKFLITLPEASVVAYKRSCCCTGALSVIIGRPYTDVACIQGRRDARWKSLLLLPCAVNQGATSTLPLALRMVFPWRNRRVFPGFTRRSYK